MEDQTGTVDPIRREYVALRVAAGLNKRQFVNQVDDLLRRETPRLGRADRCLRGLLARYGWAAVRAACLEVAARRAKTE